MEGLTTPIWMLVFVAAAIRPLQSLDATEIPMDYDSPYYVTVYQVIEGSVSGVSGLFEDPELANLKRGDYFTVVLAVKNKTELEKWYRQEQGWYEIPATFCFGDSATKCLSKAMSTNSSANYRRPYIFRPTSSEKHIPLMVPFKNFIFLNTSNKDTLPETGIVHSQFKNFSHLGGRYDTTSGVLASFYLKYSTGVGKMSDITFVRKKGQLQHQPLTECYLVEWAPDGCVPGLNTLMKGWDMKQLKLKSARWLKFGKFPFHRDEQYLETLHTFEKGRKSFLVPKGLTLDSIATGSVPYSKIYSGVREQLQETLHSLGINYKEELSRAVQGSARVDGYSNYFSGTTFTSAVAGVKYRLFRARFRPSFNFKDSSNWDEEFKRDFNSILTSRDSTETMSFFKEYGTHYLQEAVMGGRKESAFSIKYCSVEKSSSTKFELEAKLKIPYYGVHNVPPQYTYNSTMSESEKENIVYGPVTTCTGGNSLTLEVCMNDTAWRDSVHVKPYPIELAVKPFWGLVSNHSGDREWLKQEYEKYLVAQLGEEEIKADLKMAAHCGGDGSPAASFVTVVTVAILTPPTLWLLNRPVSC